MDGGMTNAGVVDGTSPSAAERILLSSGGRLKPPPPGVGDGWASSAAAMSGGMMMTCPSLSSGASDAVACCAVRLEGAVSSDDASPLFEYFQAAKPMAAITAAAEITRYSF